VRAVFEKVFSVRRRFALLVVAFSLLASLVSVAPVAAAQSKRPVLTRRFVREAPDFASTSMADSWDYAQERDLPNVAGLSHKGFSNVTMSGGRWKGTAASQANIRLLQSWTSLPNGRDGESTPINADVYSHISIRMRLTGRTAAWGELSWYDCGRLDNACRGAQGVRVFEGWHTYDFEIEREPARGPVDWSGLIRGLVFTPSAPGGNIELDWIRVYKPTNAPIRVTSRDTNPATQLIWDRDRVPGNNSAANPNWGVISTSGSGTFNPDGMFPGTYFVYSLVGGARSLVNTININKRPRPRVLQPDAIGGVDYATAVRSDAWDFSQRTDQSQLNNMTFTLANGALVGTNTAVKSDSGFRVTIPQDQLINGSRFTNFSARVFYEGGFSLSPDPGGGMNARIIWRTSNGVKRVSQDIVVFPGWNTITVDLDDTPPSKLIENGATSSAWDGQQIELLRFDPHEDTGTRKFRVDWIKLTENDKPVNDVFNIAFRDLAYEPGTIARIYLDRQGDGIGEHQIAFRGVVPKHNVFRWTVPPQFRGTGEWYVTIKVVDPRYVSTVAVSTGTIEL
jgi:hypothetical protein